MKKLIDYDPVTGIKEVFHKDASNPNKFYIETVQDVSSVIEHNKRLISEDSGNYRHGNFHHVATIPHVVIERWRKELGDDPMAKRNRKWLLAKLNDRDNQFMRTKGGRL